MPGATKSAMVHHSSSILCDVHDWQARPALLKIKWRHDKSQIKYINKHIICRGSQTKSLVFCWKRGVCWNCGDLNSLDSWYTYQQKLRPQITYNKSLWVISVTFSFNIQAVITDVAKILGGSFKFFVGRKLPPKHAWIKPWSVSHRLTAVTCDHEIITDNK